MIYFNSPKNVKKNQLKKCIFKELDEFKQDVSEALGNDVKVIGNYDGISFEYNDECLYTEEVLCGMSKYYDVNVISIHTDHCELIGIWIVYE